jgi:DNA-binding transcriptional regulator GbsR (MarR family)
MNRAVRRARWLVRILLFHHFGHLIHFLLNKIERCETLLSMKRNSVDDRAPGVAPLNPVEVEVIRLFVQLSRALGQPTSVAEIYGLLFISPRPLPQDEFYARLNLSKGSASQGLRYLLDLGAVRTVYVAGDRRVHYEAVAELRNLAGRFLRQQILMNFEGSGTLLDRLAVEAQKLPDDQRKFAVTRVKMLKSWEKNVKRVLPLFLTILGGRNGAVR